MKRLAIVLLAVAAVALQPAAAIDQLGMGSGLLQAGVSHFAAAAAPFVQASQAFQATISAQFEAVVEQMGPLVEALEEKYCSPANLTKSVTQPATFVGQGFALTFSTGNCSFNETNFLVNGIKELDCFKPSISYVKTPANYSSPHHKAVQFTTKQCKADKVFGRQVDKVLYVFGEGTPLPDATTLSQQVSQELVAMLGSISSGTAAAVPSPAPSAG